MFKCMTGCVPKYLTTKLVSGRVTHNSQQLNIPLFKTDSCQSAVIPVQSCQEVECSVEPEPELGRTCVVSMEETLKALEAKVAKLEANLAKKSETNTASSHSSARSSITLADYSLRIKPETFSAAQQYEMNQKVLNKGSAHVLTSTSEEKWDGNFTSHQGTPKPPVSAQQLLQQQAEILEKLKSVPQEGKEGMKVQSFLRAPEHALSVAV